MKLRIDKEGRVTLPEALLDRLGISPGRSLEARVEKGRLVLEPLPPEGDPFAEAIRPPADDAFEKALAQDEADKARALDVFDDALRKPPTLDLDKEREERDRWR
jgi:bifunctional DNA-binding transcriptional regulator/antitoxin component of YhaV-PrlF toxin-antitoxin module